MTLHKIIGLLTGALVLGLSIPTLAVSTSSSAGVEVCVDWDTKEIKFSKYWEVCPPRHATLILGADGEPGPQGEVGPQGPAGADGARGPRGLPGVGGSDFELENYPTLDWLASAIEETDCDTRWSGIIQLLGIGGGNIVTDEFGQMQRNSDIALELAGACPYPYPEIFENPKLTAMSNFVYGEAVASSNYEGESFEAYAAISEWSAPVSAFDATFSLDADWHLCINEDPQYDALSLSQAANWSETEPGVVSFEGEAQLTFYGVEPEGTTKGTLLGTNGSGLTVHFCGPDTSTPSGLGYRRFTFGFSNGYQSIPVQWQDITVATLD